METTGVITNSYSQCARSKTPAESAAENWAIARVRYLNAQAAHVEAMRAVEETRNEEEKAWDALLNEAGRGVPTAPTITPGSTMGRPPGNYR